MCECAGVIYVCRNGKWTRSAERELDYYTFTAAFNLFTFVRMAYETQYRHKEVRARASAITIKWSYPNGR